MRTRNKISLIGSVSLAAVSLSLASAVPPPADTRIGNQASATYVVNGETVSVESNLVETVVNEVFAVELMTDQARSGAPGGFVFFPHTLTNLGNADDTFALAENVAGGTDNFALTNIEIYADADFDGVPDSLTPITVTPSILAGATFGVVVRATVPSAATAGQVTDFTLTATSANDGSQFDTNTDTITITTDGIIDVQKDQSLLVDADGDGTFSVGDTVSVEFTYSNVGIGTSTNVVIEDVLPSLNTAGEAINLTYSAGSGEWSDAVGVTLTDATGNVEATNAQGSSLSFEFDGASTITATLDTVQPGRSGTLSFDYVITSAPAGIFENVATFTTTSQPTPTESNISPIDVAATPVFVIADAAATAATPASGVDGANLDSSIDDSATDTTVDADDVVGDTSLVYLGGDVAFDFVLTNLGNATDVFSLDVTNNDFPAGTLFDIVSSDGVTPIVGDEILVPSGETRHFQVIATFPNDVAAATASPAGFDAEIIVTSQAYPDLNNTSTLLFDGELRAPTVDLENTDGAGTVIGATGNGNVDNAGSPWTTTPANPGETISIPLSITLPAGSPSNTFDLLGSTDGTFGTTQLPEGWIVEFFDSNGNPITSTGALVPTDTTDAVFEYEARVTIPVDAPFTPAPGEEIYFGVESPLNGLSDSSLNAVTVNEIVDLELRADTAVQAAPGGVAVIPHTITNLGNSTVTGGSLSLGVTDPFTDTGMTAALFYDADGNGVLDPTDPVITDISQIPGGIAAGDTATVFVRAQVPSTLSSGALETGDVTIGSALTTATGPFTDTDTSNNAVLDTVSIYSGDLTLVKEAAADDDCDGTPNATEGFTVGSTDVDPGGCIIYRITADNTGTDDATDVIITDLTPIYTTYEACAADSCEANLVIGSGAPASLAKAPADESGGELATSTTASGFTLVPGDRAVMTFSVQVDD